MTGNKNQTINSLIDRSIEKFGDLPAIHAAFETPITFKELGEKIDRVAISLIILGLKQGDKVAILGENSTNWAIAYLAAAKCGGILVPILPDFPEADVRHIIKEVGVKFLFLTEKHTDKILELSSHKICKIFSLDDFESNDIFQIDKFDKLYELDGANIEKATKLLKETKISEDDILAIIYTSGTSGHSKAVMLSHKNICSNVKSANALIDINSDWSFLSILPMSHTYEFTVGFILPLSNGAKVIFAGKPPTPTILEKICRKEKPKAMCIVPMVIEKIYKKRVLGTINDSFLLKQAVKIGWIRKKIMRKIGEKLKMFFGGELKVLAIGGASINYDAENFLKEADFPYLVGYGLTETAPIISGGPQYDQTIAVGSVGKVVPDVEVKIVNPSPENGVGEIYARGPNIMKGYYHNKEATAETINDEGWLATGDLGYFDSFNNLYIKGRSKSVIVLAHGENIYPEVIEEKINSFVEVVESIVVDNNGRLEARVYLDYDLVDKETGKARDKQREYIEAVLKEIKREVNSQLPNYSKLQDVIERTEPFTKTATHKIKRYLYN